MASPVDLGNTQGDILIGLPKKTETFFFFRIEDSHVEKFREQLSYLVPLITTGVQARDNQKKIVQYKEKRAASKDPMPELLTIAGVSVAFSKKGLDKIGITDDIGDPAFNAGMLADAGELGDKGRRTSNGFDPEWLVEYKKEIHGVIMVAGDCHKTVEGKLEEIKDIFSVGEKDSTIQKVISVVGDVRPGAVSAHEHFGFLDGVSQPAVEGVDPNVLPGQPPAIPSNIILLRTTQNRTPPEWALDGSFLAFRHLAQHVPEFDWFLRQNPIPSAPPGLGSELLGARLVGRWKSGAPIDITPLQDDPELGKDASRNNTFQYDPISQERCPYAAHTRKTFPRDTGDVDFLNERRIIRRGIQFGPEVSPEEAAKNRSDPTKERGLLFVSYQSNLSKGFQFIQKLWSNNIRFPFGKPGVPTPGFDAIIGQTTEDLPPRVLSGTDPKNPAPELTLNQQWVVTRGGEYFFSPSIPALRERFAKKNTYVTELR